MVIIFSLKISKKTKYKNIEPQIWIIVLKIILSIFLSKRMQKTVITIREIKIFINDGIKLYNLKYFRPKNMYIIMTTLSLIKDAKAAPISL